ncbi:MAG: hypothetical protein EOO81_00115 [Oxalobacteraceae bacterium]|nr:MAG: hypothetical protein EOO81_00115 [Oxalobacteraceae bacterium]
MYGLFDPAEPEWPFYLGKGSGNRVFNHVAGAEKLRQDDLMSMKDERIAAIKSGGASVIHKVIRFGLSETEALKVEASLIDLVNHIKPGHLVNLVSGHGVAESILDTADLASALNATELESEEPLLLIKIEQKWTELLNGKKRIASSITRDEIFDAVKGDWVVSVPRAMTAKCVLAVARGLVRGVFVPAGWKNSGYENRKHMTYELGDGGYDCFVGKSVAHLASLGSQNPIRYLRC